MANSPAEKVQYLTSGSREASAMPAQIAVSAGESRAESAVTGQVLRSSRQFLPHNAGKYLARHLLPPAIDTASAPRLSCFGVMPEQAGGRLR
jgi:uncharacterized lipoprotein YbaY